MLLLWTFLAYWKNLGVVGLWNSEHGNDKMLFTVKILSIFSRGRVPSVYCAKNIVSLVA